MSIARQLGLTLDLEVSATESQASQSMTALLQARTRNVVIYRGPFDMDSDTAVASLREEVGDDLVLPADGAQYYLVYVKTSDHDNLPVLLREGTPLGFLRAHHALTVAAKMNLVTYHQPVDPTRPGASQFLTDQFGEDVPLASDQMHFLVSVFGELLLLERRDVMTFLTDHWALEKAEQLSILSYTGPVDLALESEHTTAAQKFGDQAPARRIHFVIAAGSVDGIHIPLGDAAKVAFGIALGGYNVSHAHQLAFADGLLIP